jgi:hypothetical protein
MVRFFRDQWTASSPTPSPILLVSENVPIKKNNTCVTMVMEVLLLHNMVKAFLFWAEYTHHPMHCMQTASIAELIMS